MRQVFKFPKPIPSLPVYKVIYENNKWTYCYAINTPKRVNKSKKKKPLYVKGGFYKLTLVEKKNNLASNIPIYCEDDILELFDNQYKSDWLSREQFYEKYDNDIKNNKFIELNFKIENKTQMLVDCYIVKQKRKTKTHTVFVGRKRD